MNLNPFKLINSHKISQFQRLSLHMSWLCRKYHVILRLNISSFEHLSKYKVLSNPFMTCFWLEACTPPLHQSLKHTLIFKQFKHANQAFGQKNFQSFIRPLVEAPQEATLSLKSPQLSCHIPVITYQLPHTNYLIPVHILITTQFPHPSDHIWVTTSNF